METKSIIISFFTSAAVTTFLAFIFKSTLKAKIDYYFQSNLEKYKSQLNIFVDTEQKKSSRRMEAYPLIVEQIYRARNMARDLATHFSSNNISLSDEFSSRIKSLEDYLYKYRLDLERDNLFLEVHGYKNLLLTFAIKISDTKYYIQYDRQEELSRIKNELIELYNTIDEKYSPITHNLSLYDGDIKTE
jgi:hypothetical protein